MTPVARPNAGRGRPELVTLDELGDLRPALPLNKERLEGGERPCLALCPSAIGGGGDINWQETYTVAPDRESLDRYVLKANDIVFFMRLPFRLAFLDAATFEDRYTAPGIQTVDVPPLIAVGQMATLRVALDGVDPGYVAWFLRHPQTQERLRGLVQGVTLQFIPMKAIRRLHVPLPELSVQRAIANAWVATRQIVRLAAEREARQMRFVDTACMDLIQDAFPNLAH